MKLISSFLCSIALLFSVAAYAAPEAPVNINTADVETLDQLVEVRGIGEATIESNRDHMTLN